MITIIAHIMTKCTSGGCLHNASVRFQQRYSKKIDACLSVILLVAAILAYCHVGGMYDYRALLICGTLSQTAVLSLYKCWNPWGSWMVKQLKAFLYNRQLQKQKPNTT
jgi:hypothetical protein